MKRLWVILFVLPLFAQNRVVVNTKTERIHLSRVLHLPDSLYQKEYDNKDLAINDGFELCKACFDSRPDIFDYDLEKQLTTQSIIAIKNRYEIMYEHERLESLSDIMSSVLKKWPEPLKGYSYRLQIIRDDSPNALAVAGGNIYLTTGLIDMVENDKELEAVIAHEVAHTERRHTLRSFKAYQRKQLGAKAIALLMTTFGDVAAALIGKKYGVTLIFRDKTAIGGLSELLVNLIVGFIVLSNVYIIITMAFTATIVELLVSELDDNLMVPLFTGFAGQLITFLF